jgi:hypothetical protein
VKRKQNAEALAKQRSDETTPQRGKRRKMNAEGLAKQRENETTPQREKRRKQNAEALATQRSDETTPQREKRREKNAGALAKQRENETTPHRKNRLKTNAESLQKQRQKETVQQRAHRLEKITESVAKQREKETTPEKSRRRKRNAESLEKQRENETATQRLKRRKRDKDRRENETTQQKSKRRAQVTESARKKTAKQTTSEKSKRRKATTQARHVQRQSDKQTLNMFRLEKYKDLDDMMQKVEKIKIGKLDQQCSECGSYNFSGEELQKRNKGEKQFSICCQKGKVKLKPLRSPPEVLQRLFLESNDESKIFRKNVRMINNNLAFASIAVNEKIVPGTGPPNFRIQGTFYHRIGSLLPAEDKSPGFLSIYIHDTANELANRKSKSKDSKSFELILEKLQAMMHSVNPFILSFKTGLENIQSSSDDMRLVLSDLGSTNTHRGRFNVPKADEIAIIIPNRDLDSNSAKTRRAIILQERDGPLQKINETHQFYDALHYVLFYPYGDRSWHIGICKDGSNKTITMREFYAYRLMQRVPTEWNIPRYLNSEEFPTILLGARLFQQFAVDTYAKIEHCRLDYQRLNQTKLRADLYQGAVDSIQDDDLLNCGKRVILSSSFVNGPRACFERYQDAMAIVRKKGKPDLFATITTNPNWPEIVDSLLPQQKPSDRPDLISRAFKLRLKIVLKLMEDGFGKIVSKIHVIEFQKRGLPHAHILLILKQQHKLTDPSKIDDVICSEIPSQNFPKMRELVLKHMIHGPCGDLFPDAPCMINGKCSKRFPKDFCNRTTENENGYPFYRRRSPENGGSFITKTVVRNGKSITYTIDNRWVVAYSPPLLWKVECHVNLEGAASIGCVKYVYKYINKGSDQVMFRIESTKHQSRAAAKMAAKKRNRDEIKMFLDARYLSASEAFWRIFAFPLHETNPSVVRLAVHLPNQQFVVFNSELLGSEAQLALENKRKTTLTQWFAVNRSESKERLSEEVLLAPNGDSNPSSQTILYPDFPEFYSWNNLGKFWKRRKKPKKSNAVGRVYAVPPNQGERFYLRRLLYHIPGAKNFQDLRTINGKLCVSFKEACRELGLLEDDSEWENCLSEAALIQSGKQLRNLFITILLHCSPENALALFEKFQVQLSEDYRYQLEKRSGINDLEKEARNCVSRPFFSLGQFPCASGGSIKPTPYSANLFYVTSISQYLLFSTTYW